MNPSDDGKSPDSSQSKLLEDARGAALDGAYDEALEIVESILARHPNYVDGLRFKGNILEQQALDRFEYSAKKLVSYPSYLEARACYERIREIDPDNTRALIDLGDHFLHLDALDRAVPFYREALARLSMSTSGDWRDEVDDLMERGVALSRKTKTSSFGELLRNECDALLRGVEKTTPQK